MAYAVKYILQFTSDRGNEVRIEVLKKDYQGEVIYKSLGGSPSLSIEQGDGAIKGSSLVFAMQADIEGELQELYTTDNKQFKVNMYRNEVLSWQGYILPELYSEEYVDAPYDVSVTATDQLATLKAITYQREDVNVSLSTIIEDILSFTQISVPVTYHQNLSAHRKGEVPMLVDSHISQAAYNGHSCYDVLNNILLSCNCCIMQINGEWLITSLTNSTTNYYTAGVTQVREHKALGQLGVGEVCPAGTLTMVNNPALKGARVEYAHMLRHSFLVNADCVDREGWNYTPDSRNPIDIPGEREAFGKIFKAYCWELHPVNIRENNSLQLWQEVSLEKDERNYYDLSVKTLFSTSAKLLLMAVTYLGSDGVERRLTSEGWIETWDKSDVNYYIQITGTNKNAGLDAIADIEQYEMSTVQFALPPVDGTMRVGFINSTTDYAEPLASAPIYVSQVYLTVSGVTGQECTTEVEPNATQEQQDVLLAYGDTFESENAYKLGLNTLKKSSGENITSWWLDNVNFSSYYDTMLQEFSRYFGVKKAQLQGIIMGKDVLSDMYTDVFSGRVMRLLTAQVDLLADEASVTVEEVVTTTVDYDTVIYATNNTNSFGSSSGGGAGTSGGASSTAGESLLGVQSDGDVYVKDGRALVGSEARFEKMALPSSAPDKRAEQKTYIYSSDTSRGAIDIAKIAKYIEEQGKIWVLDSANGVVRTQYNVVSTQEIISGRRASGASSDVTGGGGISQVTAQMIADALGYIPYSSANPAEYINSSALNGYAKLTDIPSLSGYATEQYVTSRGYITGITSAMVTTALGYTPYNSANFTKANIKSTLGIADWALAASKPSYSWSEVSGKPTFATVATSGKYSDLSGVPTSLPASDVYAWAKAATKPTYTASEVGALPLSGGTIGNSLTIASSSDNKIILNETGSDVKYQYIEFQNQGVRYGTLGTFGDNDIKWNNKTLIHSDNIGSYALKIDGSNAMTAPLLLAYNSSLTEDKGIYVGTTNVAGGAAFDYASFVNIHDNRGSSLQLSWYRHLAQPQLVTRISENGSWSAWKTIAFTDSNVASATKLQTARTIWGQSFDGSANVSGTLSGVGNIYINKENRIYLNDGTSSIDALYLYSALKTIFVGYGAGKTINTALAGNEVYLYYGGLNKGFTLSSSGNVLIGTTTDSGYKLDVNGTSKVRDKAAFGHTILADRYNGQGNTAGAALIVNKGGDYFGIGASSGNISNISFGWVNDLEGTWKKELVTINASNNIILNQGVYISATDSANTARGILELTTSQSRFIIGYGVASAGYNTSLQGNNIEFTYGTSHSVGMKLTSGGNILMGTIEDNGARLHINTSAAYVFHAVTTIKSLGIARFLAPNATTGVTGGMVLDIGVASSTYNSGNIAFRYHNSGNAANFISLGLYGKDNILNVFGSGNVAIGTTDSNPAYKLDVQGGDVRTSGNLLAYGEVISSRRASSSDRRLKNNITYLDTADCLAMIRHVRPAEWDWKDNGKHSMGFIAQDVEHLMPYAVTSIKDDKLGEKLNLQYDQFIALAIGGVQAVDNEVERLKARVEYLENKIKKYEYGNYRN